MQGLSTAWAKPVCAPQTSGCQTPGGHGQAPRCPGCKASTTYRCGGMGWLCTPNPYPHPGTDQAMAGGLPCQPRQTGSQTHGGRTACSPASEPSATSGCASCLSPYPASGGNAPGLSSTPGSTPSRPAASCVPCSTTSGSAAYATCCAASGSASCVPSCTTSGSTSSCWRAAFTPSSDGASCLSPTSNPDQPPNPALPNGR